MSIERWELLYGKRFPLQLKWTLYNNYVRPATMHRGEAWRLKKNKKEIIQMAERSMVRAMCAVQFTQKKIYRLDSHVGSE